MKMIDAEWEQRNLGVSAVEIEVEPNDSFEDFQRALSGCDARYLVAKISVSRSDFLFGLPELGWRFVEAQESLSLQRSVYRVPKMLRRFDDRCVYRLAENRDQARAALRHFRDGSFDTDRVALDPMFGTRPLVGRPFLSAAVKFLTVFTAADPSVRLFFERTRPVRRCVTPYWARCSPNVRSAGSVRCSLKKTWTPRSIAEPRKYARRSARII